MRVTQNVKKVELNIGKDEIVTFEIRTQENGLIFQ